jgi:hypothetical protein
MKNRWIGGTYVLMGMLCAQVGWSASPVITLWDFNRSTATNSPPPKLGAGDALPVGAVTVTLAGGAGSSDPETEADTAWNLSGFPVQAVGARTAGVEFRTSTVGHTNVVVRFDLRPSNTASRVLQTQYTVDGNTYVDGPRFVLASGGVFTNGLVADLSAVAAVADNPKFGIRMVSDFDAGGRYAAVNGNYSAAGTWRLDMVTVAGERMGGGGGSGAGEPPAIRYECRLADLVRPGDAPTNTFPDQVLGPGERLEIQVDVGSPGAGPYRVEVEAPAGLPVGSGWVTVPTPGELTGPSMALFVLTADGSLSGRRLEPVLRVIQGTATNGQTWRVHVPTPGERAVVLTEFLPNPTGVSTLPTYNPLRRDPPSPRPTQHDEYLELVNFGSTAVNLEGWRFRDSTGWRHRFVTPTWVGAGQSLVLHGGLPGTSAPKVEVATVAAGEGVVGLSLNNDGDVIALYNAATNLVFRVVYAAGGVAAAAALTRFPEGTGPFVAHDSVAATPLSPGRRVEGAPYLPRESGEGISGGGAVRLKVRWDGEGGVVLEWPAESGRRYRVWRGETVGGDYEPVMEETAFVEDVGRYVEVPEPSAETRFYRVSRH